MTQLSLASEELIIFTLPVELDANRRTLEFLNDEHCLTLEELKGAKSPPRRRIHLRGRSIEPRSAWHPHALDTALINVGNILKN